MGKSDFIDADYLSKLSSEDREWYEQFVREYYRGSKRQLHPDQFKKPIDDSRNAFRRDVYVRGTMQPIEAAKDVPAVNYHTLNRDTHPTKSAKSRKPRRLADTGRISHIPKSKDRKLPSKRKPPKKYGGVSLRSLRGLVGRIVNLVYVQHTEIWSGLSLRTFPKIMLRKDGLTTVLSIPRDAEPYIETSYDGIDWDRLKVNRWTVLTLKRVDRMIKDGKLIPSDFGVEKTGL